MEEKYLKKIINSPKIDRKQRTEEALELERQMYEARCKEDEENSNESI